MRQPICAAIMPTRSIVQKCANPVGDRSRSFLAISDPIETVTHTASLEGQSLYRGSGASNPLFRLGHLSVSSTLPVQLSAEHPQRGYARVFHSRISDCET